MVFAAPLQPNKNNIISMNKALTSDRKFEDFLVPLRKAYYAMLQVALVSAGYSADKYSVLSPSCGLTDRQETECRKYEFVEYYLMALANKIDLSTIPDVMECDLINVINADTDGTYASYTTALAGSNNDVVWKARSKGSIGNILQIAYINPAANSQPLSVSVVGQLIRVSLATSGGGAITSTASQIIAAVTANEAANSLIHGALEASNSGAGVVAALAATNLSGGSN